MSNEVGYEMARHRQTKGTGTGRQFLLLTGSQLFTLLCVGVPAVTPTYRATRAHIISAIFDEIIPNSIVKKQPNTNLKITRFFLLLKSSISFLSPLLRFK